MEEEGTANDNNDISFKDIVENLSDSSEDEESFDQDIKEEGSKSDATHPLDNDDVAKNLIEEAQLLFSELSDPSSTDGDTFHEAKQDLDAAATMLKDETSKTKPELRPDEMNQLLLGNLTHSQLDRYEIFRRSSFAKPTIKRLVESITGTQVSQNVVIAIAGVAKVFTGEIIEAAIDARKRMDETESGALQPKHIREAARTLNRRKKSRLSGPGCAKKIRLDR